MLEVACFELEKSRLHLFHILSTTSSSYICCGRIDTRPHNPLFLLHLPRSPGLKVAELDDNGTVWYVIIRSHFLQRILVINTSTYVCTFSSSSQRPRKATSKRTAFSLIIVPDPAHESHTGHSATWRCWVVNILEDEPSVSIINTKHVFIHPSCV